MRAICVALAVFAAACASASAQEAPLEPPQRTIETLPQCLAHAGSTRLRMEDCKGELAGACIESDDGMASNYGQMLCWEGEQGAWEAEIDGAHERAGFTPAREAAFTAAQARWIEWRIAECRYRSLTFEGGSYARVAATQCMAELAAQRAIDMLVEERDPEG